MSETALAEQARIFGTVQGDFIKAVLKGNAAGIAEALREGADPIQRIPLGKTVPSEVADLPVVIALARRDLQGASLIARAIRPGTLSRDQLDEILAIAAAVEGEGTERSLRAHLGKLRYGNLQISATPGEDLDVEDWSVLARTGGVEADRVAWTTQAHYESELKGKSLETALMAEAIRRLAGEKRVQEASSFVADAQAGLALLQDCFKRQGVTQSLEERLRGGAQALGSQVKKLGSTNPFARVLGNIAGDLVSQFALSAGSEFLNGGSFDESFWKRQEKSILNDLWKEARKNPWVAKLSDGVFGDILSGKIQDTAEGLLKKAENSPALQFLLSSVDASGNLKIGLPELEAKVREIQGQLKSYGKEQIEDLKGALASLPNASDFKSELPPLTAAQIERLKSAAAREEFYAQASATIGLATDFMSALGVDRKTVRKVATVAQAGLSLARGIDQTIQAFSATGLSVGMNLATAAMACNIVGVVTSVMGMLSGTPSQEQMMMEALGQISEQINALGEHMDARFDALEAQIAQGFQVVSQQLDVITSELAKANYKLSVIEHGVNTINAKLDDLSVRLSEQREILTARMNAGFERDWPRILSKCQKDLPTAGEFEECFGIAVARSTNDARDALAFDDTVLTLPAAGSSREAWNKIETDRQFVSALNALGAKTAGTPSYAASDLLVGNRTTWAQGANLALDLLESNAYRAKPQHRAQLETLWGAMEQFEEFHARLLRDEKIRGTLSARVDGAIQSLTFSLNRLPEAGLRYPGAREVHPTAGLVRALGQIREHHWYAGYHFIQKPILEFERMPLPVESAEVLAELFFSGTLSSEIRSLNLPNWRDEAYKSLAFYLRAGFWNGRSYVIPVDLVAFSDEGFANWSAILGSWRYELKDPRFAPTEWKAGQESTPAQHAAYRDRVVKLLREMKVLPHSALVSSDPVSEKLSHFLAGADHIKARGRIAYGLQSRNGPLGDSIEALRLWTRLVVPETARRSSALSGLFQGSGLRSDWHAAALNRRLIGSDPEAFADTVSDEFYDYTLVVDAVIASATFDSEFPHLASLKARLAQERSRLARIAKRTEPGLVVEAVAQSPTVLKGKP